VRPATTLALALLLVAILTAAVISLFVLRDSGGSRCPAGEVERADGTCGPAVTATSRP
jgi:hypothetical protein